MTDVSDPMPAPQRHQRARLIRRVGLVRWDWYAIRKEVALFVIVTTGIVLSVVGAVDLLRDPPKPVVIDNRTDPDLVAQTYASRVAQLFLTYDEATASQRADQVAALVPGAPVTLGWDGHGKSTATVIGPLSDVPAADDPTVRQVAVYVVANGTPRTVIVRVRKDPAGVPSPVGVPTLAAAPRTGAADQSIPQQTSAGIDLAAADDARPTVVGFLSAWGAGDPSQSVYAADGFRIPPGPGGLRLVGQPVFTIPQGDTTRTFVVYVRWATNDPDVTYPSAYQLTLVRSQQRWSVQAISTAPGGSLAAVPS